MLTIKHIPIFLKKSKPTLAWKGVEVVGCSKNLASDCVWNAFKAYIRLLFGVFFITANLVTFVTNKKNSSNNINKVNNLDHVTITKLLAVLLHFVTFCYNLLHEFVTLPIPLVYYLLLAFYNHKKTNVTNVTRFQVPHEKIK